jgi:hypothetical protein
LPQLTLAVAVLVVLPGCITSEPLPAALNSPRRPLTDAEKGSIGRSIALKMKDPDSAKFMWMPVILLNRNGITDYCGLINSKTSFGGYAGFTKFYAQLHDNGLNFTAADLRSMAEGDEVSIASTTDVCSHFGYIDFSQAQ